jgi:hypothetical protein
MPSQSLTSTPTKAASSVRPQKIAKYLNHVKIGGRAAAPDRRPSPAGEVLAGCGIRCSARDSDRGMSIAVRNEILAVYRGTRIVVLLDYWVNLPARLGLRWHVLGIWLTAAGDEEQFWLIIGLHLSPSPKLFRDWGLLSFRNSKPRVERLRANYQKVGRGGFARSFRRLQFTLRRKVPFSDAAIIRLQKWGAGIFGRLEEVFRGFQLPPKFARWINHWHTPWDGLQHRAAAEKRPPWRACLFLLWVWPAGHKRVGPRPGLYRPMEPRMIFGG